MNDIILDSQSTCTVCNKIDSYKRIMRIIPPDDSDGTEVYLCEKCTIIVLRILMGNLDDII